MNKPEEEGLRAYKQTVEFSGQEDHHSVDLYSTDVTVYPSPGGQDHGSSKVKLKNIVDFSWEPNFYTGQLLAVHMSGKYLAYGLKANGVGIVRVVYKDSEQRALLRGMRGAIQDLAFAHVTKAILACIDYTGSLFVHTIVSTASQLVCNVLLMVNAEEVAPNSHRVIWCPYIPDEDSTESEDVSKLLMVTRGPTAELWCVDNVYAQLGPGPLNLNGANVRECGGFAEICEHSSTIVEAILSPDGTAIATASLDGEIKFFQVNIHGSALQQACCLHKWKPHNGRPVSSLFFLDDHKNYHSDAQFWRFAITGCDNNTELKVWSCEKWKCLQTIKFQPSPINGKTPVLKAGLDLAAGFLLLSDICNKGLYILSLTKDTADGAACVSTISEFRLPYPILSFGIVDAGIRKVRPTGESLEDLCPCDDESDEQLVIRMYLVQPKSLQECHIAFQPARQVANNCMVMDTLTHDSLDYNEDLQHIRHEQNGIVENGEDTVTGTIEANHNASLNLMTPDAFSSPAKKESNHSASTSPELGNVMSASPSLAQAVQALNASDPPLATSEMELAPPSGGSSPSREVREILSLAEPEEDEEDDDLKALDGSDKNEENWSNIPMVLLKEVHRDNEELPENDRDKEKPDWIAHDSIANLTSKLDTILATIQEHRQELVELRSEVTRLRQETPISARVESAMARAHQQQLASIEQGMYSRLARQSEFIQTVEDAVKDNIINTLPRVVNEVVEPLKHNMKTDVKRFDDLLKENITQLISGSHMRDLLTNTVVTTAKPALDKAFKEAFAKELLPGIEKACDSMFRQIQDTFARGTRDYLQHIEAVVEKTCQKRNEASSEALSRLVRDELQSEMAKGFGNVQEGIFRTVRDTVRENMSSHFSDIQARSRATTPGISQPSPADAQARVLSLLQRGQLNAAFQQALSASDLGLVVLVCEKTEPTKVFSTTGPGSRCLLQQPVILSLVQQLSADLGHRTELKHKWLEEAILNLDPTDPVTREHMGAVLMTLQTQLASFIAANPLNRSTRRMKMLSMAARALLHQHP